MILIDSVYVNEGGGKVLLKLLIKYFNLSSLHVFYLFDERVKEEFLDVPENLKSFCNASLIERHRFYKNNVGKFSSVLSFNNVPPTVRLNCRVYTYFHNALYLEVGFFDSVSLFIKGSFIKFFRSNSDKWIVQSNYMRESLAYKWKIDRNDILILPIFDDSTSVNFVKKSEGLKNEIVFIYVSDGHPHKNHMRLLDAFEKYFKSINVKTSLIVTISEKHTLLKRKIQRLVRRGVPIFDVGFVSQSELSTLYLKSDVAIYPSLHESFGLGLIEASKYNLPIIASNLSYVFEVVEPNLTFNPRSVEEIQIAFERAASIIGCRPKLISENLIEKLIHELNIDFYAQKL